MAVTDRNIVITPNRTAVGSVQPKIVFTGADSNIGDSSAITLFANPDNSGTLSFSGTAGQLFSITNSLTGTIFSVNDVSGIPSLSINDQGVIQLAEFNGRVIIGDSVGSDDSVSSLQISGALTVDSATINGDLTLVTTDAGATADPSILLKRISASPAFSDQLGEILFQGKNDADSDVNYAKIVTKIATVTDGGEGGNLSFNVMQGGTLTEFVQMAFNNVYLNKQLTMFNNIFLDGNYSIKWDGATNNSNTTSLVVTDPTAVNTITLPDATGTVLTTGNADTPTTTTSAGDADFVLVDDGGTMKKITPANLGIGAGGTDSAATIALIDSAYVQSRVAVGSINNVKNDAFTGNASTTAFGLSVTPADSDDVFVFVNGVLQHTNTYSLSGSTITLDSAPDSSSTIDIRTSLIHSTSISLRDFQNYIYTLSSTLDSVSGADSGGNTLTYDADKVDVYVNGARLVNGKDYTAGNGTQIVFDSALHAGNIIEVVSHSKATALEPELTSVDTSLDSAGANQAIYSFSKSAFRTFKFTAQLTHSSSSSFHSEEILLTHNGTTVAMTTYAQVLLDSNLGSFDATISGSNVQLNLSPTKTNVGIKLRGVRTPV